MIPEAWAAFLGALMNYIIGLAYVIIPGGLLLISAWAFYQNSRRK